MQKAQLRTAKYLDLPPVDWEEALDLTPPGRRGELCRAAEAVAFHAAMFARYVDERDGHGYGDQGHEAAVKSANRAAKKVWCGAFGYNECPPLSF